MQRRIEIDGVTYICNVTHSEDTEFWTCANEQLVAEFLKRNGVEVKEVYRDIIGRIEVNRTIYNFRGECYVLNQCEGDLFEWFKDSMPSDFTYYFDKVVFNTEDGFLAAYRDNINNTISI